MKNCTIYLSLSFCFFLFFTKPPLQAQSNLGVSYWENVRPSSSLITRLYIDDRRLDIVVFENCNDGPCGWGRETLMKRGNDYLASYRQDFVEYRFRVRMISKDRITVLAKMKYQDSDSWDYSVYSFKRSLGLGKSGGISTK